MEVIMKDNTVRDSADVMSQLIESAVDEAVRNSELKDLSSLWMLKSLAWEIVDHHEVVSCGEIMMNYNSVLAQLKWRASQEVEVLEI